jgi:hypothetical protein
VERENFERRGRMDFRVRAVQTTGEQVVFEVVPDPRRYEWIEDEDGERWLFDRFNYCRIPPEMVERMASELVGGILAGGTKGPDRQLIEDADAYVKERVPLIERQLDGELPDEPDVDTSEEVLRSLLGKEVGTAFLVIDIAGSTVLADRVAPAEFERLIGDRPLRTQCGGAAVSRSRSQIHGRRSDRILRPVHLHSGERFCLRLCAHHAEGGLRRAQPKLHEKGIASD